MLQTLKIKNVAILSSLNIDFEKGFNVLLGETGAGKSIIFDSLQFVLGGKADKSLIRYGENEMRVDAVFDILSNALKDKLNAAGIEFDDELLISRTYSIEGKNSMRINGSPVVSSMIKNIAADLVDSYSQHESQNLLKSSNHLKVLDDYAKEKLLDIKSQLVNKYSELLEINKEIKALGGSEQEREREIDILKFQIEEIASAELENGEEEYIKEKLNFYNNSEKIAASISTTLQCLEDTNPSALSLLNLGAQELSGISDLSQISSLYDRLKSSIIEIQDIADGLNEIKSQVDFDEREFNKLDSRLDKIKLLNKKYGGSIENCLKYLQEKSKILENLIGGTEKLEELRNKKNLIEADLNDICLNLSKLRMASAKDLEEKVILGLKELGMKNAKFKVNFIKSQISSNGFDEVSFLFTANLGQELRELSKVASGGELSRFMLVFKNILAEKDGVNTLVFDEIDSGISGEVGFKVAEKLAQLAKNYQILCITHLPQVAAAADAYFKVYKKSVENNTETYVEKLNEEGVWRQIAFLAGGDLESIKALEHAKDLKNKLNNFKSQLV